jgi:hypothetical protein
VVSGTLSLPALGCFSPVPHGTRSLSVTRESLALEGGPPSFTPDSSELGRYSGNPLAHPLAFAYRALTVYGPPFQESSADTWMYRLWLLQPHCCKEQWFGLGPRSLAATWGISVDFSFLEVLRCFSSLGSLSSKGVTIISDGRVSPFGHPGLIACVPLPLAYRSLPRPSSPPCTQASPTYLLSLDQISVSKQNNHTNFIQRAIYE